MGIMTSGPCDNLISAHSKLSGPME